MENMSFFSVVKPSSFAARIHLKCALLGKLENAFLYFNLQDFTTLTLNKNIKPKEPWSG